MNNKYIIVTKLTVLCVIAAILIIILIVLLKGSSFSLSKYFIKDSSYNKIYDEEFNAGTVQTIQCSSQSADVNIKSSSDGKIKVEGYGIDGDSVEVTLKDGVLSVECKLNRHIGFFVYFTMTAQRIDIYVPEYYDGSIEVNTTSGDVNTVDLANAGCTITTTSGDINVGKCTTLKAEASSGDIKVKSAETVDIETTSGDIRIEEISVCMNISSTSGDIKIENAQIEDDCSIKTTSGDIRINGISDVYVSTDTNAGDVKISSNNRYAEYELTIKTTSGDIVIK